MWSILGWCSSVGSKHCDAKHMPQLSPVLPLSPDVSPPLLPPRYLAEMIKHGKKQRIFILDTCNEYARFRTCVHMYIYISCTYTYVYPFISYVHFVYTCIEILSMYTRLSEHSLIVVPEVVGFLGAGHAVSCFNMSRGPGSPPKKNPTASLGCWGAGIL